MNPGARWQPRRKVRRYHLKRPVEINVGIIRAGPKPWARFQAPTDFGGSWQAEVHRGPRKALYLTHLSGTREGAVQGLLEKLQRMGYSGTARVV